MSEVKTWYSMDTRRLSVFGKVLWVTVVLICMGIAYSVFKTVDNRTLIFGITFCSIMLVLGLWVVQFLKDYMVIKCESEEEMREGEEEK